jgi:hypothetical protein
MRDYATDIIVVMNQEYLTEIHATLAYLRSDCEVANLSPVVTS